MKLENVHFNSVITAPHSKSYAIRALLCAALSDSPCDILLNGSCEDTETALRCIKVFGAETERIDGGIRVTPSLSIANDAGIIPDFGDCATALRLFWPLAAYINNDFVYKTSPRLAERVRGTLPPVSTLNDTRVSCEASVTSQSLSGLLFLKALSGGTVEIPQDVNSLPYILITLQVLSDFGAEFEYEGLDSVSFNRIGRFYSPTVYTVEGDWSGAANLVLAGIIGKEPTEIRGIKSDTLQGDRAIVDILRTAGASIGEKEEDIICRPSRISPFDVDASAIPDLVPVLAVAACAVDKTSVIRNVSRLKYKESDRVSTICEMISAAKGYASFDGNDLYIRGPVCGGIMPETEDHRIAMAQVLLSLLCPVKISEKSLSYVNKSYPEFLNTFRS